MRDMKSNLKVAFGISATLSGTTAAAGNIVDLQGVDSATFLFLTSAVTDAGTTAGFAVEVQHSDTKAAADFTAVADTDLIGLESALTVTDDTYDSKPVGAIGYRGTKRYARVVITGTTGTNAVVFGAWVLGNLAQSAPASGIADNIAAT